MKRAAAITAMILLGIPLLAWPFAMLANLMGIAAIGNDYQSLDADGVLLLIVMAVTTVYPLAYGGGIWMGVRALKRKEELKALSWCAPAAVIVVLVLALVPD